MGWRHDLEIISAHARGPVWDGDQIDKRRRDDLILAGYLTRKGAEAGYARLTLAGERAWARWRIVYAVWVQCLRLKWRMREAWRARRPASPTGDAS